MNIELTENAMTFTHIQNNIFEFKFIECSRIFYFVSKTYNYTDASFYEHVCKFISFTSLSSFTVLCAIPFILHFVLRIFIKRKGKCKQTPNTIIFNFADQLKWSWCAKRVRCRIYNKSQI